MLKKGSWWRGGGGPSCNLTGDRWIPSDQITSDQIPSDQITLDQITLDQTTFDQMTLDQMTLNQIILNWTILDQIAFDNLAENISNSLAYCFWGKSGGAKEFLKYSNLRGKILLFAGFASLCKSQNFLLWLKALHHFDVIQVYHKIMTIRILIPEMTVACTINMWRWFLNS